jgi:hypothetical protein
MNKLKRYIPELVHHALKEAKTDNKEHLYIICDMIYRISIYNKDDADKEKQYTDIPKKYFNDIITKSSDINVAKNYLLENKIIDCDYQYSIGEKSFGYKINKNYVSKLIPITLENTTLTKRIIKNKNTRNNLVNGKLNTYKNHFLTNFKLNHKASMDHLDQWFNEELTNIKTPLNHYNNTNNINTVLCGENDKKNLVSDEIRGFEEKKSKTFLDPYLKLIEKYNKIFISINSINDDQLYFRKNKTNGRVDTNLTTLKKEYRKFIITEKPLINIDIINSQPYFLSLMLNTISDQSIFGEKIIFHKWTSTGRFYENFEKIYFKTTGKTLTRNEIKEMMFCILYSKKGSFLKEKNIFKIIFPNILKIIENKKNVKHNQFAIDLQKLESEMVIDIICQELDKENIKYYTIHDSWVVNKEDKNRTMEIIEFNFNKIFNSKPKLKEERI